MIMPEMICISSASISPIAVFSATLTIFAADLNTAWLAVMQSVANYRFITAFINENDII